MGSFSEYFGVYCIVATVAFIMLLVFPFLVCKVLPRLLEEQRQREEARNLQRRVAEAQRNQDRRQQLFAQNRDRRQRLFAQNPRRRRRELAEEEMIWRDFFERRNRDIIDERHLAAPAA